MKPASAQPIGSICLLRLSALGDVCNMVPVVRALRRRWPDAELTWIVGRVEHRLIEDLPGVEYIVFDKRAGLAGILALRRALRGRRFDVLLHAQVSLRANLLSLLVRARRRIGFDRARAREGHHLVVSETIPACAQQHQALAFREFAKLLDASVVEADRALPIPESARQFAAQLLPEANRAVLISPASSHSGRNWSSDSYARVADWVLANTSRPVVLIGGPSAAERDLGQAIVERMEGVPLNLIGKDTLKQALALIERSACLVTPDAGPAHFAAALGVPVVGLYAATWSKRSGPLGSLDYCVDRFSEAARRYFQREPEQLRWGIRIEKPGVMDLIKSEEVIASLASLLEEAAHR